MASLSTRKNGSRFIQFNDETGTRRTINLGKIAKRQAESIHTKVERLLASRSAKLALDPETSAWVGSLSGKLRERLANAGLIDEQKSFTLRSFIDDYLKRRTDIKPRTHGKLEMTGRRLCEFFGDKRRLESITKSEAIDHHRWLLNQGLSTNSANRESGRAKQFFADALERRLITENPFKHKQIPTVVKPNKDRLVYVSRETIEKVLAACPTAEWRAIVGLARFGGLRCPSEVIPLQWEDIDWDNGRFTITSPKTEHHPNGGSRQCPLFPELRLLLGEWQEECGNTTGPVITRYRDDSQNLGTTFRRFIEKAGLELWPKLFQNCRSTRETELVEAGFPTHVVCEWIGNSELVAKQFYLQVTDEHFQAAAGVTGGGTKALQKALQTVQDSKRQRVPNRGRNAEKSPKRRIQRRSDSPRRSRTFASALSERRPRPLDDRAG